MMVPHSLNTPWQDQTLTFLLYSPGLESDFINSQPSRYACQHDWYEKIDNWLVVVPDAKRPYCLGHRYGGNFCENTLRLPFSLRFQFIKEDFQRWLPVNSVGALVLLFVLFLRRKACQIFWKR